MSEGERLLLPAIIVMAFGLFCEVGGIIGYIKARSLPSLLTGALSGLLLQLCGVGLWLDMPPAAAGSVAISMLLGGRFAMTWRRTRRLMPDLLMVLFSAATLLAVLPLLRR